MNNNEKLKDAYEKLQCFNNPILQEIAKDLEDVHQATCKGIEGIIRQVAKKHDCSVRHITNGNQAILRQEVAIEANRQRYTQEAIANALNKETSTIHYYIKTYHATS